LRLSVPSDIAPRYPRGSNAKDGEVMVLATQAAKTVGTGSTAVLVISEAIAEAQAILDDYAGNSIDPHIAIKRIQTILENETVVEAMKSVGYYHE
jgi:hypothetical protein